MKALLNGVLYGVEQKLPGSAEFTVASYMIAGSRERVVIDSLMRPSDMSSFQEVSYVIYTHADWDHCWGTPGLPGSRVIAHRSGLTRLMSEKEQHTLDRLKAEHPTFLQEASIVLPSITFTHEMELNLGGITVRLVHLPGHTEDSLVVHVPELDVLIVGDVLEEPFPYINEPGYIRPWIKGLRESATWGTKQVFSSHSGEMGIEDLTRTADYLESLLDDVSRLLKVGCTDDEIVTRLPLTKYLNGESLPGWQGLQSNNVKAMIASLKD